MTFENTVARYRKCVEHRDELKDIEDALNGEIQKLEAEIVAECLANNELFNVFERKTSSAGLVGRNYFQVTFSKSLVRRGKYARLDEQDWLRNLPNQYVATKRSLLASKIIADYSAGKITETDLREKDLSLNAKPSLTVKLIPSDAALAKIREYAEALVDDAE